jgi:hypothetical protein
MSELINYIGKGGKQFNNDCHDSLAKSTITPRGKELYFVKFTTAGVMAGHIADPWNMYYKDGEERQMNYRTGKATYEYQKVNKEVFDLYIRYLETQNSLYYRQAERLLV